MPKTSKEKLTREEISSWPKAHVDGRGVLPADQVAEKMRAAGAAKTIWGPQIPHSAEFTEVRCRFVGPRWNDVQYAAVDNDGKIWEWGEDGYTWVPTMSEEEREGLAARISSLVEDAHAKMREASELAEEAGLTFRMRSTVEFHGFYGVEHGDEWYGGWDSSYC